MKATKIKMYKESYNSNSLLEIEYVYLTGCDDEGYYKKESIYDYLKKYPGNIQVNIYPYPNVIPALSEKGQKYVKSSPNSYQHDNLLSLPRD